MRSLALLLIVVALSADEFEGYVGRWVTVTATAYSPYDACDQNHWSSKDTITSIGRDWTRHPYGVAVPYRNGRPLFVPYGTKIIIPRGIGYLDSKEARVFTADDTGGRISQRTEQTGTPWIDLRFRTSSSAMKFVGSHGRRRIKVFVVEGLAPPKPEPVREVEQPPQVVFDDFSLPAPEEEQPVLQTVEARSPVEWYALPFIAVLWVVAFVKRRLLIAKIKKAKIKAIWRDEDLN